MTRKMVYHAAAATTSNKLVNRGIERRELVLPAAVQFNVQFTLAVAENHGIADQRTAQNINGFPPEQLTLILTGAAEEIEA